jgi:hypothetical protein
MRERRVWRFLNCMSTPCDMQSFIVWVIARIAERVTVRKAMSRDEVYEGAEGNVIFRCAAHEDG